MAVELILGVAVDLRDEVELEPRAVTVARGRWWWVLGQATSLGRALAGTAVVGEPSAGRLESRK